jgi:hypothetical protein
MTYAERASIRRPSDAGARVAELPVWMQRVALATPNVPGRADTDCVVHEHAPEQGDKPCRADDS